HARAPDHCQPIGAREEHRSEGDRRVVPGARASAWRTRTADIDRGRPTGSAVSQMRTMLRLYRALFVTNRSLTTVVLLFLACIIVALSTGFWLTWRLAYVAMIGVPVAYVWSRLNLRGNDVVPDRQADRLQECGQFDEPI